VRKWYRTGIAKCPADRFEPRRPDSAIFRPHCAACLMPGIAAFDAACQKTGNLCEMGRNFCTLVLNVVV